MIVLITVFSFGAVILVVQPNAIFHTHDYTEGEENRLLGFLLVLVSVTSSCFDCESTDEDASDSSLARS